MKPGLIITSLLSLILFTGCNKPGPEEDIDLPAVKDYPYEITSTGSIRNIHEFLKSKNYEELDETISEQLGEVAELPVKYIDFTYPSVGPGGVEVTLSARLYILDKLYRFGMTTLGMVLVNHATMSAARECPTRNISEEAVVAWSATAVVVPDYYGFGASGDKPQAYLNGALTAKGSLDAFKTARKLLRDKGVIPGNDYYNFGYSQGGYNAIANLKYISDHPDESIKFKKTFAGAGPYDLVASYEEYLTDKYPAACVFIPMTITALNECGGLGLDYSTIFREPLASNHGDWILSKNYSVSEIYDRIGTSKLTEVLTDDILKGKGEAITVLLEKLEEQSVVSGWQPRAGTEIMLYHSTEDDVVPSFNSDILCDYLRSVNADVTLVKEEAGGHTEAVESFLYAIASEFITIEK